MISALLIPYPAAAQVTFQFLDVSEGAGIEPYAMAFGIGAGVAAADFDDDGDIDIFVPTTAGTPDQLYVNLGVGVFSEQAAERGLNSLDTHKVALWLDYDGDHLLDLAVAGDCYQSDDIGCSPTIELYRQTQGGLFENVTAQSGLINIDSDIIGGMAAGDINGDGFLDLILSVNWPLDTKFFLNNGDGSFSDISQSSGINIAVERMWQPLFHDFNGDGRMDLYATIDFSFDRLWINQGDNRFIDGANEAGTRVNKNEMGIAAGDYDNDQDIDLFVSNIPTFNRMFRNDSVDDGISFTDIADEIDVDDTGWAWGCTFLDADNDGLLDLAVTNGYHLGSGTRDPSAFFLNRGGIPGGFDRVSDEVGFNDTFWGSCLLAFDYNRDGRLDLLQTTRHTEDPVADSSLRLLENRADPEAPPARFLIVRPRQDGPNHWAIGAIVRITTGDITMTRLITAGTSFMGQEPAEAHFGLGLADRIDTLRVEWPNGDTTVIEDIAADQMITVTSDGYTGQGPVAPHIVRDPSSVWIEAGDSATLTLVGNASPPIQWFKDDVPLADDPPRVMGTTSAVLSFDAVALGDSGTYHVTYDDAAKAPAQTAPVEFKVVAELPLLGTLALVLVAGVYAFAGAVLIYWRTKPTRTP